MKERSGRAPSPGLWPRQPERDVSAVRDRTESHLPDIILLTSTLGLLAGSLFIHGIRVKRQKPRLLRGGDHEPHRPALPHPPYDLLALPRGVPCLHKKLPYPRGLFRERPGQ